MNGNVSPLEHFGWALVVALVATSASYGIATWAGWISGFPNLLEASSVFFSYACTYLCVKQTRWNYPVGVIAVALLAWFFYSIGLYASMALQLYLLPTLLYGWFRWGRDESTRPVQHVGFDWWLLAYGGITVATYFVMREVTTAFGATAADLDSSIFALSVLAQFLLDNKKVETWAVWAIVNVVSIYLYFNTGAYLLGIQFIFFLANTLYGWYSWHKSIRPKDAVPDYVVINIGRAI